MSWLDILPSSERQRIREKFKLSASAYEDLREKVKGPEDMEREMKYNEALAGLKFGLETEPALKNALKKQIENDVSEQGIEQVMEFTNASPDLQTAIEQGSFEITIDTPEGSDIDQLVVHAEGNIAEKLPIKKSLSDQYISQFQMS